MFVLNLVKRTWTHTFGGNSDHSGSTTKRQKTVTFDQTSIDNTTCGFVQDTTQVSHGSSWESETLDSDAEVENMLVHQSFPRRAQGTSANQHGMPDNEATSPTSIALTSTVLVPTTFSMQITTTRNLTNQQSEQTIRRIAGLSRRDRASLRSSPNLIETVKTSASSAYVRRISPRKRVSSGSSPTVGKSPRQLVRYQPYTIGKKGIRPVIQIQPPSTPVALDPTRPRRDILRPTLSDPVPTPAPTPTSYSTSSSRSSSPSPSPSSYSRPRTFFRTPTSSVLASPIAARARRSNAAYATYKRPPTALRVNPFRLIIPPPSLPPTSPRVQTDSDLFHFTKTPAPSNAQLMASPIDKIFVLNDGTEDVEDAEGFEEDSDD